MKPVRRHVLLALVSVLVALAWSTAATAGAAPARVASAANLCTVGKGVVRSLTIPKAQTLTTAQAQANLLSNLGKIVAAKSALVPATPSALRPSMRTAIALFALLKADLATVGGNFALLANKPALLNTFEARAQKATPAFNRLSRYVKKTCHA